jgi:hypothetical protein
VRNPAPCSRRTATSVLPALARFRFQLRPATRGRSRLVSTRRPRSLVLLTTRRSLVLLTTRRSLVLGRVVTARLSSSLLRQALVYAGKGQEGLGVGVAKTMLPRPCCLGLGKSMLARCCQSSAACCRAGTRPPPPNSHYIAIERRGCALRMLLQYLRMLLAPRPLLSS